MSSCAADGHSELGWVVLTEPLHHCIGSYVAIAVQSRPELNSRTWVVKGLGRGRWPEDRVIVESMDDEALTISVQVAAVSSLALVPLNAPPVEPSVELNMLELFVDIGNNDRLNKWWPLPGLGGNYIMLRAATDPTRELIMFPRFKGYEFWFYSTWYGEHILLEDTDTLKECPQKQVWPWCCWCRKFLLPPDAHRRSRAHEGCRRYLESFDRDQLRRTCLEHLRRYVPS
jgi:hypothetical protein